MPCASTLKWFNSTSHVYTERQSQPGSALPGKHEHVIHCRLSKRQRTLYEEYMAATEVSAWDCADIDACETASFGRNTVAMFGCTCQMLPESLSIVGAQTVDPYTIDACAKSMGSLELCRWLHQVVVPM
eukprot:scaffold77401_cov20-Tisochrysis_lutea.AAC.2